MTLSSFRTCSGMPRIKSQRTSTMSAVSDEKREAHSGVIRLVTRASTRACEESDQSASA